MKKIFEIFVHLIRRILYWVYFFTSMIVCGLIYLVTFEVNTYKTVTLRKVRRIRVLTRFKLWLWRNFWWLMTFIEVDGYYKKLEKKFLKDGM